MEDGIRAQLLPTHGPGSGECELLCPVSVATDKREIIDGHELNEREAAEPQATIEKEILQPNLASVRKLDGL
jgi:hypothetical protein